MNIQDSDFDKPTKTIETLQKVTIRMAGDSGDGMQLAGTKFTTASVIFGNDVSTLPEFPAEIRAPAGTLAGVSSFQVNFGSGHIFTPGDKLDTLVVMNPAALKVHLHDLKKGGNLIINIDAFTDSNLSKAGYDKNPLFDDSLKSYKAFLVKISTLNENAVKDLGLDFKQVSLTKNFFALGLACWLYDRPLQPTIEWINEKFSKVKNIAEANTKTLKAGFYYGETAEIFPTHYKVPPAKMQPGLYRRVSGNEAIALGLLAGLELANIEGIYSGYPITPASDILHELSKHKERIKTFQAEDEIAAIGAAVGASFGGTLGITASSGPGIALKGETMGLAVILELPLVIVNVQRAGPSTGMPTKTEQGDLLQAMFGRNGESPVAILAPRSASDCFDTMIEAVRLAIKYMTPVLVLSDGYLGNSSDPWLIPKMSDYPKIEVKHPVKTDETFSAYKRNKYLARDWAIPGTKDLEHQIGGLEKDAITGGVSYDPANHHFMVSQRAEKIARIAFDIPKLHVEGPETGDLLVLGWGSTYGAILTACNSLREQGYSVASAHLKYLNPFPTNLKDVLHSYKKVLIPEINLGQLRLLIQGTFLIDTIGFNKVTGKPFQVHDLEEKIIDILS